MAYKELNHLKWHTCKQGLDVLQVTKLPPPGMYGLAAHEEKDDKSARWMEVAKVG